MSEELQVAAMVPKQEDEKDPHFSSKEQDRVITMDHGIFMSVNGCAFHAARNVFTSHHSA